MYRCQQSGYQKYGSKSIRRALGSGDLVHKSTCCICLQNSRVDFILFCRICKDCRPYFYSFLPPPHYHYLSFRALPWLPLASSSVLTQMSIYVPKEGTQDSIFSSPLHPLLCGLSSHVNLGAITWQSYVDSHFPAGLGGADPTGSSGPFCVPKVSFDQGTVN